MRPTPRYDGPPVIEISAFGADVPPAVSRQRDRLSDTLAEFSRQEWAAPSRCAGWTVQDVARHLITVDQFWVASIGAGVRNEPTRFLASFDPVADPAGLVERARGSSPEATLEELRATNAELAALLRSLSDGDRNKLAEAPPGHLAIETVCAHALWDAWIHERDILLPLGLHQSLEDDEVTVSLAYAAALGPAIHLNSGRRCSGTLSVQASNPGVEFTVDIAQRVRVLPGVEADPIESIDGEATDLTEGLSTRAPLPIVADDHRWLVDGLQYAFGSAE